MKIWRLLLVSNRISMINKLVPQKLEDEYTFDRISTDDIDALAVSMFEAFQDTVDYEGESLEDLKKELCSVIEGTFGIFIHEASFQIKQNGNISAVILISLYKDKLLVSELFTTKEYLHLGMASSLLKKSINELVRLGYENIVLNVHPQNVGAVNLYRKIGFVELDLTEPVL